MEKSIIGYLAYKIPRVTSPGSAVGNKRGEREGGDGWDDESPRVTRWCIFAHVLVFFLLHLREG